MVVSLLVTVVPCLAPSPPLLLVFPLVVELPVPGLVPVTLPRVVLAPTFIMDLLLLLARLLFSVSSPTFAFLLSSPVSRSADPSLGLLDMEPGWASLDTAPDFEPLAVGSFDMLDCC